MLRLYPLLVILFSLSSCLVSKKKFDEQKALADKLLAERNSCREDLEKANALIATLSERIAALEKERDQLQDDLKKMTRQKEDAEKLYSDLKKRYDELLSRATDEKSRFSELLKEKERELNAKAKELDELAKAMAQKQQRIDELERLISKKDEALNSLKKRIADALTGFTSDELTVTQKDGKIYVSMSDKLLFKTGSYNVDTRGKQALAKLAEVLNKNPEIGIMV
ncbi:MAG: hypothetical protein NZ522_00485, partial [Chitinophagales bacterium]|nr:hypothetical protein [Chitinophagales bacterium]